MKIWTKLINEEKIIKSFVFKLPKNYNINRLELYLSDIACELDIEKPILLKKHYEELFYFKRTTFFTSDFIDTPKFDKMICELIA